MDLSALAGNSQLKKQLAHREGGRGLGHAYILSGPQGSGRHTLAGILSAAMVCQREQGEHPCMTCPACKKASGGIHPDVIYISGPEGKPISVDQVRQLRADAHIRPNEARRKVYLLERADRMNPPAQNAMLKLLEEGPAYAAFLLLTENSGGLLTTIRSRCETLTLAPLSPEECRLWLEKKYPQESPQKLRQAALDCQGILGHAVAQVEGTAAAGEAAAQLAKSLALAVDRGEELELLRTCTALEKLGKEELGYILDRTVVEIGAILPNSQNKKRLFDCVQLLRTLRGAVELNANAGQLSGWLCAGVMSGDTANL